MLRKRRKTKNGKNTETQIKRERERLRIKTKQKSLFVEPTRCLLASEENKKRKKHESQW